MTTPQPRKALLLTGDLLFSTKVTGTARALGLEVDVTASAADTASRVQGGDYALVILDLSAPGLNPAELVPALAPPDGPRPPVIAFGSHVDTERLSAARAAGCHDVMPRSRFSAELPQLLTRSLKAD